MTGWTAYYRRGQDGVPENCINKLCVVRLKDGPTLIKQLTRGSKKNRYTLKSWNADPCPTSCSIGRQW